MSTATQHAAVGMGAGRESEAPEVPEAPGETVDEEDVDEISRLEDFALTAEAALDYTTDRSHNIVGAAVTLGLSVIMLILMAIVAGYFVAEAPSNGAFSSALDQIESVGGTAFILLAVALLGVPVVAIIGYFMRSGLSGFITGGGMGRRR